MTEPATPPEPRCNVCPADPSLYGPVLRVGAGGSYVDFGHPDCPRLAEAAVRAEGRAELTASAS
jgi:hypothetical protein